MKLAPNPNYRKSTTISKFDSNLVTKIAPSSSKLYLPGPILDQGIFGTCTTFSVLGVMANSKNLFRYSNDPAPIFTPSTSCFLQMLTANGINAWDGFWSAPLLTWLNAKGAIPETLAQTGFCNSQYPTYYRFDETQKHSTLHIPMDTYVSRSEKPTPGHMTEETIPNAILALNYIKQKLSDRSGQRRGYYTLFTFYYSVDPVTRIHLGDGLSYTAWVNPGFVNRGVMHTIYAYGYDDNITINGQKGVLFLRNSWGKGNYTDGTTNDGNYLMTYSYFLDNYVHVSPIMSVYANCRMGTASQGCID